MAYLWVTEYESAPMIGPSLVLPMGLEPNLGSSKLDIEGQVSEAFGPKTRFVRVHAEEACLIDFGGGLMRIAADATEFFGVPPGGKIAVTEEC